MSFTADPELELVCFNSTGLFSFADPLRIEAGREKGQVAADVQVQFAQGEGSYELTVYREDHGGWSGAVSKVEIRAASGITASGAWQRAGSVPVDTGTIAAFDAATVLANDLSYDDLFADDASELPAENPTFFCFATGVGDGRYDVMCDNKDAATIVSITFIADEEEEEDDWASDDPDDETDDL